MDTSHVVQIGEKLLSKLNTFSSYLMFLCNKWGHLYIILKLLVLNIVLNLNQYYATMKTFFKVIVEEINLSFNTYNFKFYNSNKNSVLRILATIVYIFFVGTLKTYFFFHRILRLFIIFSIIHSNKTLVIFYKVKKEEKLIK